MDLLAHYRMMARYNRIANQRLYEACTRAGDEERRKERAGSFGSIHALLNHMLLGDRIWMDRFEGGGRETPRLNTILYDDFAELAEARHAEDERIVEYFYGLGEEFLLIRFPYVNNQGREYEDAAQVVAAHFFNHQTHHRGQVHVMLSQAGIQPPSLDLHRIISP